jgi:broad specificity phosphatase PhoE
MSGQIILIRHGETQWSLSGKHTGATDISLTAAGEAAARSLRSVVPSNADLVLCSPLLRAQRTAALAGLDVTRTEPNLVEWDYGNYEGRTTSEIRAEVNNPTWLIWDYPIPNGEQLTDVALRVDHVIAESLPIAQSGGTVALVAHGHVLRILTARWLGLSPINGRLFALSPATVSTLGFEHEHHVITKWNSPT